VAIGVEQQRRHDCRMTARLPALSLALIRSQRLGGQRFKSNRAVPRLHPTVCFKKAAFRAPGFGARATGII